jgi:hypothetical protein
MNDKITISLLQLFEMFPDQESARLHRSSRSMLCEAHQMEMPEEAIRVNIGLNDYFGRDVLTLR